MTSLPEQISQALRPHTQQIVNHAQVIDARLGDIHREVQGLGRPDYDDRWQYLQFNTPAAGIFDIAPQAQVPRNEVWLIQTVILLTDAVTVIVQTDGGVPRAMAIAHGMQVVAGSAALLPGERAQVNTTGPAVGTIAIIRRVKRPPELPAVSRSNEQVAGHSNTHNPDRDNLGQRGLYPPSGREVRPGEGLRIMEQPPGTRFGIDPTAP